MQKNMERTLEFCQALASRDGRTDDLKRSFILTVRQAINVKDAAIALRMVLSADWRRTQYHYGRTYEIVELDFEYIAQRFWRLWRRKSSEYFMTYVQTSTVMYPKTVDGEVQNWTRMFIFIGDTKKRMQVRAFNIGKTRADMSAIECFAENKETVLQFIRKYASIVSRDARMEVKIYGDYGNQHRHAGNSRFLYEYER